MVRSQARQTSMKIPAMPGGSSDHASDHLMRTGLVVSMPQRCHIGALMGGWGISPGVEFRLVEHVGLQLGEERGDLPERAAGRDLDPRPVGDGSPTPSSVPIRAEVNGR
jgi:hypothetical protein